MQSNRPSWENDSTGEDKEAIASNASLLHRKKCSRTKVLLLVAAVMIPSLALALGLGIGLTRNSSSSNSDPRSIKNSTVDSRSLETWWHPTGEINTKTAVEDGNVRQSHMYSVQVSSDGMHAGFHDSFVYETIPRSGKGKICVPNNATDICEEDDGITIEEDIGVTMAWSQFLYSSDVYVKVSLINGSTIDANKVTIRPTTLSYKISQEGSSAIVKVPYNATSHGVRFSLELLDDMWEYRNAAEGSSSHYVQNANPDGQNYVNSYGDLMPVVGREPTNALLIFASPFPEDDLVPKVNHDGVYKVPPGRVPSLNSINASTVVFEPGVYYATGSAHIELSPTVDWVYFAPGSYVKGAIKYSNRANALKATGFGVLSGEQYVYQANVAQGYRNNKSDEDSIKMWRGQGVTSNQSWTLNGITVNAAPFNSMDFYGDTANFAIDVSDYKQVGSFYTQTDGLQMYPNSHIRDVFYHTGDDTIKTYYSNIHAERIVVWKTNNGPVVQMGWAPREISNVTIQHLDIIHSRYNSPLEYAPRALIGSSSSYGNTPSTETADTTKTISNYKLSQIRSEGISPNLISLNLLSNLVNMTVEDAWIEELAPETVGISTSTIRGFTDPSSGEKISMGDETRREGLNITGYAVGKVKINFVAQNWESSKPGGFWVDSGFDGEWGLN